MKAGIRGLIVTAAFIGPGTVTTASIVGANTAYHFVYLLLFSLFATYILQEMSSRLGTVSKLGLSAAIVTLLNGKLSRVAVSILIVTAIGIGNAAYEGGNITGAALGLSSAFGASITLWSLVLGLCAFLLLLLGHYAYVEKILILLVVIMSFVFIFLAFTVGISLDLLLSGLSDTTAFSNSLAQQGALALALVGTTIVPYNLYLHSGLSARDALTEKNDTSLNLQSLKSQNIQLGLSISMGGIVTLAILSSSVSAFFITQSPIDKSNIAQQLAPLLGSYSTVFFGLGLFAAGLTSAITAPLAAAYAISGLFDWDADLSNKKFKLCSLLIVAIGTTFASLGIKPFSLILLAQTANAILLPVSIALLLLACNSHALMGRFKNSILTNVLAFLILLFLLGLMFTKFLG